MQWERVGIVVELALHSDKLVTAHLWISIGFAPEGDVAPQARRRNGTLGITESTDVKRAIKNAINQVFDCGWAQVEGERVVASSHVKGNMDHLGMFNAQTSEKICPNIRTTRVRCAAEDLKVNLNPWL